MLISVVIASRNEGENLTRTVESIRRTQTEWPYEIVIADDCDEGSVRTIDGARIVRTPARGYAGARNLGARASNGEVLVFADAHIDVSPNWLDELIWVMETYKAGAVTPCVRDLGDTDGMIGCGMTLASLTRTDWNPRQEEPQETPLLSGACYAVRADAFRRVGGYEESFRGYGCNDEELSIKLWLNGFSLYTCPRTCVAHKFRDQAPYRIPWTDAIYNKLYLALCHYGDERVARLKEEQALFLGADTLYHEVFTPENIQTVRIQSFARRVHSDDWFFRRFGLEL
ncbi:MAG: glycosyltransferase [Oscillospiraceae bacterium]|jgi:GT2 family glycosyltransferase|nr:glycosyltransferase [Oscillospiraceae bacterium]